MKFECQVWAVRMLAAVLACVASWCLPGQALAATPAGDVAATRAYLSVAYAYERGAYADVGGRIAALEAQASEIAGECPSALTYAPRDEAFAELTQEVGLVVVYASLMRERSLLLREARGIAHLWWSNSRLTRLVHLQAAEEFGITSTVLPDVCAEIAVWKAGGYAVLPEGVSRFLARAEAIEVESYVGSSGELRETAILRLLKPYETPADRRIAEHIMRLEAQYEKRFFPAISAVRAKLGDVLGAAL
jgi:hypothetical protein